ncbi:response regulator [Williamwhitmania taraxaci]|uniref:Response regulator receiver domain-containing protein n=1 Tax=Williamwhitmania taraxaci TaxID=1640674 RepID=A0A1G6J853_9BACT|nr:response regulator [Williamwhitmania taraxaci]SDC14809.1 Response regulator receiver domain-containing protein [Williamwhitmania taraxaci]
MKIKTILLAEDNKFDAELTQKALAESNLANNLVTVSDGVEVLDYLRYEGKFKDREHGNPAVILLDIKMPRLDGIETLQVIRTDPKLKMIPVVILSSSREEQDLIRSYALGVNGYVVKPVDFKQFVEAVKSLGVFWVLINEQPPS